MPLQQFPPHGADPAYIVLGQFMPWVPFATRCLSKSYSVLIVIVGSSPAKMSLGYTTDKPIAAGMSRIIVAGWWRAVRVFTNYPVNQLFAERQIALWKPIYWKLVKGPQQAVLPFIGEHCVPQIRLRHFVEKLPAFSKRISRAQPACVMSSTPAPAVYGPLAALNAACSKICHSYTPDGSRRAMIIHAPRFTSRRSA